MRGGFVPGDVARGLGEIVQWPGGYAMTLGRDAASGTVRCCSGHQTPQDAKHHGLVRLHRHDGRVAA